MPLIHKIVVGITPFSVQYFFRELFDDIEDIKMGRKVSRNIFRISATVAASTFGALLPSVIAKDSIGDYFNHIFNAILESENDTVLSILTGFFFVSVFGALGQLSAKSAYRFINTKVLGHEYTNSHYNFKDNHKRIKAIAQAFQAKYHGLRLDLIEPRVKEDIEFLLKCIEEFKVREAILQKNLQSTNTENISLTYPIGIVTKKQLKIALDEYTLGYDGAYQRILSLLMELYPIFMRRYEHIAIRAFKVTQQLEAQFQLDPNLIDERVKRYLERHHAPRPNINNDRIPPLRFQASLPRIEEDSENLGMLTEDEKALELAPIFPKAESLAPYSRPPAFIPLSSVVKRGIYRKNSAFFNEIDSKTQLDSAVEGLNIDDATCIHTHLCQTCTKAYDEIQHLAQRQRKSLKITNQRQSLSEGHSPRRRALSP